MSLLGVDNSVKLGAGDAAACRKRYCVESSGGRSASTG